MLGYVCIELYSVGLFFIRSEYIILAENVLEKASVNKKI